MDILCVVELLLSSIIVDLLSSKSKPVEIGSLTYLQDICLLAWTEDSLPRSWWLQIFPSSCPASSPYSPHPSSAAFLGFWARFYRNKLGLLFDRPNTCWTHQARERGSWLIDQQIFQNNDQWSITNIPFWRFNFVYSEIYRNLYNFYKFIFFIFFSILPTNCLRYKNENQE